MRIEVYYEDKNNPTILDVPDDQCEIWVEDDYRRRLAEAEDKSTVAKRTVQQIMNEEFNNTTFNNNQTETRRHVSFDALEELGIDFVGEQGVKIDGEEFAELRDAIAKLKPTDNSGIDLTGGYIVRIDPAEGNEPYFTSDVPGITSMGGGGFGGGFPGGMGGFGGGFGGGFNTVTWTYYYPKSDKITEEQQKYISDYIKTVEKVIQSDNFADPDEGYAKYISVQSFVDYFIHTELSLNADGLKRSAYFYKKKQNPDGTGGKLHAGTVWDYNLAYGNCNFCNANKIDAWVYEGGETNPTPAMWKRLTEDPAFMDKVKARWKELRKGVLSIENINRYIDSHASQLAEAQERQYSKYSDLLVPKSQGAQGNRGGFGFGGFGGFGAGGLGGGADAIGMFAAYRVSTYQEEIATLKKWFADRIAFLDSNWK